MGRCARSPAKPWMVQQFGMGSTSVARVQYPSPELGRALSGQRQRLWLSPHPAAA